MRNYVFAALANTRQPRRRPAEILRRAAASLASLLTFGSGLQNLASLLGGPMITEQPAWLHDLFPIDFNSAPRTLTLVLGFALVLVSLHLATRRRRAFQMALVLAGASTLLHFTRDWNSPEAICSAILAGLLLFCRREFTVRSSRPVLREALRRAGLVSAVVLLYGVAGFWLLEPHEFGHNFQWREAALRTGRVVFFLGDEALQPRTPYAGWFLDSLQWISGAAFVYMMLALLRPVAYRFQHDHAGRVEAIGIAARYGRSGQDFFKLLPDKTYFFSGTRRSFIAYRVGASYALALGDPVGPEEELEEIVRSFVAFCQAKGWGAGFHQVHADRLPIYQRLGFRRIKVGDDAVVDLAQFSLEGSAMKEFRNTVNRLDRAGFRVERLEAPLSRYVVADLKRISDAWLELPGHRERRFTLGRFDEEYVTATTAYIAFDGDGRMTAFLNLVPSFQPGLATVDLMRRLPDSPNGVMDYLFAKTFLDLKNKGYVRFSLGMAPVAGLREGERPNLEERLVAVMMKRLPGLFRADSLRRFKSKYAHEWEPRYDVYRHTAELPRLGLALRRVSEIREDTRLTA